MAIIGKQTALSMGFLATIKLLMSLTFSDNMRIIFSTLSSTISSLQLFLLPRQVEHSDKVIDPSICWEGREGEEIKKNKTGKV